ncbi:heavy metal translocating P-type ATPase [Oceanivirga salmonicida]|uniref:heavy metal translocating P-type ATPase n=1 Tax=Oceanivirga salmonicida TaxID=1769291 RepID=UPI0012E1F74B|nr:heavy metal translocating P-type ATPase [Oceanivirga salmonicida]
MEKYILENLDCIDCALKLEKTLKKETFIKYVSISYATKTMLIDTTNIEKVKNKINKLEKDIVVVKATRSISEIEANKEINKLEKDKYLIIVSFSMFLCAFIFEILQKYFSYDYTLSYIYPPIYVTAYIIIGLPVLIGAYNSIINKDFFNEKVLMAISTIAAFSIGAFEESAAVMIFYSIGEYFQNIAIINSRKDIKNLIELKENIVHVVIDDKGNVEDNDIEKVVKNSNIIVKLGEVVPLDSIIVNGSSEFDLSMLTGETIPKHLKTGDTVLAGSINMSDSILLKTINEYENSSMFKLVEIIEESMHKKSKIDKFITNFSNIYTPTIILLAIMTLVLPSLFVQNIDIQRSIYNAIILLVIACPCAMVLSIPLTYFISLSTLAKKGILVKAVSVFDSLENIDTVLLDKTGTITEGNFSVVKLNYNFDRKNKIDEKEMLEYIYLAEKNSNHPIAKSITNFIDKKYPNISSTKVIENIKEIVGLGMKLIVDDYEILIGNDKYILQNNITIPNNILNNRKIFETNINVIFNKEYILNICLEDKIKGDSKSAIEKMRLNGINKVIMLTGDSENVAKIVSEKLNLDKYYCDLLPQDKLGILEKYMIDKNIMCVGDGINDAPVISRANVGVAMGKIGSDIAVSSADVIINTDSLSKISELKIMAKKIKRIIYENIVLILIVKSIIIILGIFSKLPLWVAVFGDVGVAIIAILNSMRLKKNYL